MKNRKQEHFLRLYEPVHNRFERFCRARVYGQMDFRDLMNETLLIAYQKFHTLKSDQAFLAFLFGICVRVLANLNRKKKEEHLIKEEDLLQIADSEVTDKTTEVYLLHQTLAMLPEAQRESLILFEISGFSIKEIAVIHEVSESAVKKRLERGRAQLSKILNQVSVHQTGKEMQNG